MMLRTMQELKASNGDNKLESLFDLKECQKGTKCKYQFKSLDHAKRYTHFIAHTDEEIEKMENPSSSNHVDEDSDDSDGDDMDLDVQKNKKEDEQSDEDYSDNDSDDYEDYDESDNDNDSFIEFTLDDNVDEDENVEMLN